MTDRQPEPPQYVAGHLRDALAEDPRTSELGVKVIIRGEEVFLRGSVSSDARRERVIEVVHEKAPELTVHDELTVPECGEPDGEERLR